MYVLLVLYAYLQIQLTPNGEVADYYTKLFAYNKYECFTRYNELRVNIDAGQLCVVLDPTRNISCDVLPKGVYFDVYVSYYANDFLRFLVEDYSYGATTYCGLCQDPACSFVENTTSAMAYLRTYTREVEVKIGRIVVEHTDLHDCFSPSYNSYTKFKDDARFLLKPNGKCMLDHLTVNGLYVNFIVEDAIVWQGDFYASEFTLMLDMLGWDPEWQVNVPRDWTAQNELVFDYIYVFLKMVDGTVEYLAEAEVNIVYSGTINQLMTAPTITLYPESIYIAHLPLWDADYKEEALKATDSVQIQINVMNLTNAHTIGMLKFLKPEWKFTTDADKNFKCADAVDYDGCFAFIYSLMGKPLTNINFFVFVIFYQGTTQLDMGSQSISQIYDSCWQSVVANFEAYKLCFSFVASGSEFCPFAEPSEVDITLSFAQKEAEFVFKQYYSVGDSELCFECARFAGIENQECNKLLQAAFYEHNEIKLVFDSDAGQQEITATQMFNNDYRFMYKTVWIFAAVALPCMLIICVLTALFKGSCIKRKQRKAVTKEIDDIK